MTETDTLPHRPMPRKFSIIIALLVTAVITAAGVTPTRFLDNYNISCYTMADGLPCNHVDDMCKDSKGFLWVAFMGGGLSRFDGYDFVNFDDTSVNRHIKSNFVRAVAEDKFGRLWVAGEGGIDVIDLPTLSLTTVVDITGRLDSIIGLGVSNLMFDSHGALWISGPQMVDRLTFDDDGTVVTKTTIPVPGAYYQGIVVREIDGEIWIPVGNTVYRARILPDGTPKLQPVAPSLSGLSEVGYFSDFVEKDGQVWISTDHGLFRYDPASGMVKHYLNDQADEHSLPQNFLTDVVITGDNRLVLSTLKGLCVYNPIKDDFDRAGDHGHNLSSLFVNMMLVDGDNIFVGTEGGGINVLSPRRLSIRSMVHDPNDTGSISDNPVNAIIETPDGTLWAGTVEGGVNVRHKGSSSFDHITTSGGSISHNSVSALAVDGQGDLWVGTWGGGIDIISTRRPYRRVRRLAPDCLPGQNMSYIGMLCYDDVTGMMFVGSNAGILSYDTSTGKLRPAIVPDSDYHAFGYIGALIDGDRRLWIGSADGLTVLDLARRNDDGTFPYRYERYRLDAPESMVPEKPTCFYQAPDGIIWAGTNGHGIYRCEKDINGEYMYGVLTVADGLSNNTVKGITGDSLGNLWIATINGLSCYNPVDGRFSNYTTSDGLPDNQFYWNAVCNTADGRLLFGTTCGIAEVVPDSDETENGHFPVVFTRLFVGNRVVNPADSPVTDRDIAYSDRITIHESDRSLLVEFSALDFGRNADAVYQYRLKGFDKDWITVSPERRWASYTNLSPGEYVLQVKYLPGGNDPDASVAELPVVVRPYFYRSSWFMILVTMLVIVLAAFLYRRRVSGLKRQRRVLREQIDKSTAQLAEQKKLVEHRANELAERNEQLVAQNEEISRQKQQLTEMNRQVQEMTVDRLSFFTNITHEFRTPITLIIGPIERALKLSTNPKVVEQLQLVERNSKYLLTLVNQLMDFRKIESGKMEIMIVRGNFRNFIAEVMAPFVAAAADRNIELRCLLRLWHDEFAFDGDSLRKVIVNLVSNAIKYTPDGGRVTLYAAACGRMPEGSDDGREGSLYIGVSDTGSGISEGDLERVFDRFYQGASKLKYPFSGAGDSGIGLYVCRSIVEVYGGSISVRNNRREGCTFRVMIPVTASSGSAVTADASAELPGREPALAGESGGTRPTILVVEDNEDMRKFIGSILSDTYNIIEAPDGAEALELLLSTPVDLIVSDIMMPVMDGLELSRRVKENFAISHIPFIMLTAKTSTESRIDSYRIGVDDYLLKPFDERVLLARIEGILRNRRRLQHDFAGSMDVSTLEIAGESRDKKFLDQVMDTVKNNYKNSYFEVGDFAEALGISRSLLNKKLQSLMGQSAGQLIRNYRLNMARELILKNRETRAMNISEIAYEVGFNDSKYFTRCFTRQYNTTPSAMLNGS